MRKKLLFVIFSIPLFSFGLVRAADINVTLPGITAAETSNPGGWVSALYRFSLMAAGLLAFGMIVYAGLKYTFAAGNPSTQSDARDQILQALLGVLLLLGAYIVLITINPNLINLQLPGLRKIEGQGGSASPQSCSPDGKTCCSNGAKFCAATNGCILPIATCTQAGAQQATQNNNDCENSAINSCGSDNACTCSGGTSRQCTNNGKQKSDPNYSERFICK